MSKLKHWFDGLEAGKKKKVVMGGAAGAALILMGAAAFLTDDPSSRQGSKKAAQTKAQENVLLGSNRGREIGLMGVSDEVRTLAARVAELEEQNRQQPPPAAPVPAAVPSDPDAALRNLQEQLAAEAGGQPGNGSANQPRPAPTQPQPAPYVAPPPPAPAVAPQIQTTRSEAPKVSAAARRLRNVYLPTGSIMTGVLLNGLDAPTGRTASGAPIPVVVRIKHDAILPSQYRSDVREAFVLASGFGDLSAERAYLRAERFAMILQDGSVIDLPIKMAAIGNDGKTGMRGRVVSKQGALIGQALLAGVADGVSRAFGSSNVSFGASGEELPDSRDVMISGIGGGTTGALDRIAAYFLSQAEAMYPVVEVEGGREVSLMLLEGLELAPRVHSQDEADAKAAAKADTQPQQKPQAAG